MQNYLGLLRAHLGIKSRRSRGSRSRNRDKFPIFEGEPINKPGDYRIQNSYKDRLVVELPKINFYEYFYGQPRILSKSVDYPNLKIGIANHGEGTDSGTYFGITANVVVGDYIRLVAKTAHSYAAAKLGLLSFRPFLNEFILDGTNIGSASDFIGTVYAEKTGALHRIWIDVSLLGTIRPTPLTTKIVQFCVVYIQLFALYDTPVYQVVVGDLR